MSHNIRSVQAKMAATINRDASRFIAWTAAANPRVVVFWRASVLEPLLNIFDVPYVKPELDVYSLTETVKLYHGLSQKIEVALAEAKEAYVFLIICGDKSVNIVDTKLTNIRTSLSTVEFHPDMSNRIKYAQLDTATQEDVMSLLSKW